MIVEWCQSRHLSDSGGRCVLEDGHDGPHTRTRRDGSEVTWTDESEAVAATRWRRVS